MSNLKARKVTNGAASSLTILSVEIGWASAMNDFPFDPDMFAHNRAAAGNYEQARLWAFEYQRRFNRSPILYFEEINAALAILREFCNTLDEDRPVPSEHRRTGLVEADLANELMAADLHVLAPEKEGVY